jgi:hypothetical protein
MRGYDVVTSGDRTIGTVVDVREGFLIVESDDVLGQRRPVPQEFVHAVDSAAKAFVTVPRRILQGAPIVDRLGNFDRDRAARWFGLAPG